jgi:transposase
MTHPGVGPLTALAYVLIIGTPTRFERGKQIATYVGMIPSEDSSAGKQRLGHISKQGSSLLRFRLVEAPQAAVRIHPDWRRRYIHLAMRRHKSIAKVAMGRRLAIRLYCRGNYVQLPKAGELNSAFEEKFEFLFYKERRVGPGSSDTVVVRMVGKRKDS